MSDPRVSQIPSDEILVAYLDGELPAEERARLEATLTVNAAARMRLEHFSRGGGNFAAAFQGLFDQAPAERLAAMLHRVQAEARARHPAPAARGGWRPALLAASVALLILGGVAGYFAAGLTMRDEASMPDYWREVVAEYVALYTPDTFAGFPDDVAIHGVALTGVGSKIGLDLTPEKVALPGLALKGAIIFTFRDKPLAQVAYLSPQHGPVAFCVIANGQPDQPPTFEVRDGLNIVYWAKGGHGYLVIGTAPRTDLEAYAATLNSKVS